MGKVESKQKQIRLFSKMSVQTDAAGDDSWQISRLKGLSHEDQRNNNELKNCNL